MTIGNPAFCLALYLTGVHFWGKLHHVGDVKEQKIMCRPIRTQEIGGARLSEELYVRQSIEHTENVLEDKLASVEESLGHTEKTDWDKKFKKRRNQRETKSNMGRFWKGARYTF